MVLVVKDCFVTGFKTKPWSPLGLSSNSHNRTLVTSSNSKYTCNGRTSSNSSLDVILWYSIHGINMERHYSHLLAVKDGFVTGVTATRAWSTGAIPGWLVWCGNVYGLVWYGMVTTTISCMVWYGIVLYGMVLYSTV